MTPLAHEIMRARLGNDRSRLFSRENGSYTQGKFPDPLSNFKDLHFFEVSDILDAARELTAGIVTKGPGVLGFLPAPRTWIEHIEPETRGGRRAFRLVQPPGKNYANVEVFFRNPEGGLVYQGMGMRLPLLGHPGLKPFPVGDVVRGSWAEDFPDAAGCFGGELYSLLAMINTPRVIGRRQHMPHRGLERELLQQQRIVGKFPLKAWTELILKVTLPRRDESEPHEAHLTGQRALHFVRCHLRIRLGMLELVSAHWRGDGALGIKQTRYRLEMA